MSGVACRADLGHGAPGEKWGRRTWPGGRLGPFWTMGPGARGMDGGGVGPREISEDDVDIDRPDGCFKMAEKFEKLENLEISKAAGHAVFKLCAFESPRHGPFWAQNGHLGCQNLAAFSNFSFSVRPSIPP